MDNYLNNRDYFFPKTISDIKGFAIFTMDPDGIITYWNKGCEVMKGYTSEEILGQNYGKLFPDFLIEKGYPMRELEDAFRNGKYENENWRVKKNGELFWAYVVLTKVIDEKGKFIGYVKITQDHSDRKRLEDELKTKNEKLVKINHELQETKASLDNDLDGFIYTAYHDLKAPVSNMEGILNAFQDLECYNGEGSRPLFDMLTASVEKFKSTIKELTDISKTIKAVEEDVQEVYIKEILDEVKSTLFDLIEECNAQIEIKIESSAVINFSQKNLRNILFNLLNNAIKYHCPEGTPEILIKGEAMEGYYMLMVKDNGLGFKKEQQEKAFLMFKRFHTHVEGAGIGLYTVKKILEKHGGRIELESEVNNGSTFKVYFKL